MHSWPEYKKQYEVVTTNNYVQEYVVSVEYVLCASCTCALCTHVCIFKPM